MRRCKDSICVAAPFSELTYAVFPTYAVLRGYIMAASLPSVVYPRVRVILIDVLTHV